MRRGSLVGPLLLILIGVWFLLSSLRPDLPLLDLAARYWPFLLIGWGALRLAEILVWAARRRGLPQAGITGGEWTLIVFLCLIGSGLYAANRYRPWQHLGIFDGNRVEFFGHSYDYTVPAQTLPKGQAARVLIENLRGSIRVTGADTQELKLSGSKSIRALQETDAEAANRQTPVELSAAGDQIVVRTNQDRITGDQRVTTDIEITLPRTLSLQIRSRSGGLIEVGDVNGPVELSADSADSARVENVAGNVRFDVRKSDLIRAARVKGEVEIAGGRGRDIDIENVAGQVSVSGSYSGDVQFRNCEKPVRLQSPQTDLWIEKLPGQVHMDLGSFTGTNLAGPVRFSTTRSRDVRIEQFTQSLDLTLDRGDITLRPMEVPLARINASTRTGEIDLALPGMAKFDLKATTSRGEVTNDFGAALTTRQDDRQRHRSGGSIAGATGAGPAVVVTTDRGSITIRKDSGAPPAEIASENPKPPTPPAPPKVRVQVF
jgi:DUF4097 and DUF4098 domain-containing protein YvlB